MVGLPEGHFAPREQVPSCPHAGGRGSCGQPGPGVPQPAERGVGSQADSGEEGRALTPLTHWLHSSRLCPPGQHGKDLMGWGFPPHPRERTRILPTLSPLGELISLFPDTLNFPLAFRLILGSKESQKSPKISTKKKSLLWVYW